MECKNLIGQSRIKLISREVLRAAYVVQNLDILRRCIFVEMNNFELK
ncbi:14009_t:CDS:2 [Racocetra fulgida]|uniref:14009_t:CDS:1 n=1 Tax=Racocetra fulgida TaxID=60492 RepID=A0A9N8YVA3_9GLOM|nr:14009_t:CDS:2 [Racocetra fulgida]